MRERAGSQLFRGVEPILLRRSFRTASGLPELMREGRDLVVSERGDAMSGRSRLVVPLRFLGVFQRLP